MNQIQPSHSYQSLVGQDLSYSMSASKSLNKTAALNDAQYNYPYVNAVLELAIEENLITSEELKNTIASFGENKPLKEIFSPIEELISSVPAKRLTDDVQPIIQTMHTLGMSVADDFTIGDIQLQDMSDTVNESTLNPVFTFDDILQVWEITIDDLPKSLAHLYMDFTALLAKLTMCDNPKNYPLVDWELQSFFEELTDELKEDLLEFHKLGHDSDSAYKESLTNVLGDKLTASLFGHIEDYHGIDEEDSEEYLEVALEMINEGLDGLVYEQDPLLESKSPVKTDALDEFIARIETTVSSLEKKYLPLIDALNKSIQIVNEFYYEQEYSFDYCGDVHYLGAQQFIIHKSFARCFRTEERINKIAKYLMETCETAQLVIDINSADCMRSFRNIQMGWLLLSYLENTLFDFKSNMETH